MQIIHGAKDVIIGVDHKLCFFKSHQLFCSLQDVLCNLLYLAIIEHFCVPNKNRVKLFDDQKTSLENESRLQNLRLLESSALFAVNDYLTTKLAFAEGKYL